jgi:cellulose/xylan binding protein with CBM9 domain
MIPMRTTIVFGVLVLASSGCKRTDDRVGAAPILMEPPRPAFPSQAILHERSGTGAIAYLGLDASPKEPERGQVVELTQYYKVVSQCQGDYDAFVHGDVPGGAHAVVSDHAPAEGRVLTSRWRAGEIWVDRDRFVIPNDLPSPVLEIYTGLFKGDVRLTVEAPPGASDGQDRIKVATLRIGGPGPKDDLPEIVIHRTHGKITPDGVLDEPDWAKAEPMALHDSLGRPGEPRFPTTLKLLWDDENVYVAFDCVDEDITERFSKRDDPIYDHEAVEVFLMPHAIAPALGPYVELQASPTGVIFDAAFTARRQGMDTSFNAAQTVGTRQNGTLNKSDDTDKGWVSEWSVPWKSIRGVTAPPKIGEEWRMNAFRIEKGKSLPNGEYTAWSPPKVGDFHNVARFGRMKLDE